MSTVRLNHYWAALLVALGAIFIFWIVQRTVAQDVPGQTAAVATVPGAINYQGQLTDPGGDPLNGSYTMRFLVYNDAVGGTALWDSGNLSVNVVRGLFTVELAVSPADYDGQALWLSIIVNGETLSPRQQLLPVPYALSVRPGASVNRTDDGDAFTVRSLATGFAIRGESSQGTGVYGYSDDNYAVFGFDGGATEARGYGGYFYSENGVGAYGRSNASSTAQNLWAPGVYGRSTQGVGVYGRTGSTLSYMAAVRGENDGFGYGGYFSSENGLPLFILRNTGIGNLIEAWTLNPVNRLFRVNTSGHVYADGTYFGAGGVSAGSADLAEMVLPGQPDLEPGDVLIIGSDGLVWRSSEAYQATVVGVFSTEPGFIAGNKLDEDGNPLQPERIPMAVAGIVPVKATSENGPIQPGDLLTSSSTPGHAMRCVGADQCFGRTIGKSLAGLENGDGVIEMLVVLQ